MPAGTTTIDLSGKHLLPGLIDDQVHCREPGLTHKATLATESLAALCGGVTSFLDMPNTQPPTTDRAALAEKRRIAAAGCHVNYGFYLGATNTNLEEIKRVTTADACGVKVFMGASTGNMLVDDPQTLEGIFAEARVPIATHCEYSPLIFGEREALSRALRRRRPDRSAPFDPFRRGVLPLVVDGRRSRQAPRRASARAAPHDGARARAVRARTRSRRSASRRRSARITCGSTQSSYAALGTKIKCNPAIKTAADRAALRAAVVNDRIDVIATDHAPHTLEEKARGYFEAPSGLPLVQHSLLMLLDQHARGLFSLPKIVEKAAHNPAVLFGIAERGFIREGYFADLVAVDLAGVTRVDAAQVRYKCGWSPFEGTEFRGSIVLTVLNGVPVFRDGQPVAGPARPRGRSSFGRVRDWLPCQSLGRCAGVFP